MYGLKVQMTNQYKFLLYQLDTVLNASVYKNLIQTEVDFHKIKMLRKEPKLPVKQLTILGKLIYLRNSYVWTTG